MSIPSDAAFILKAREYLALADPALATADKATPAFEWRLKPAGFAAMVKLILEQQVSTASAAAIWKKLEIGVGIVTPEHLATHTPDQLKVFGLSGQKARYVIATAEAQLSGDVDFGRIGSLTDEEATAKLTSIKGIGRWTAEAYLMGSEGRTDIFPAGDLALQEGLRMAEASETRLGEKPLYQRAEKWRPYRAIAAHLLWAYYGGVKRGDIVPPDRPLSSRPPR